MTDEKKDVEVKKLEKKDKEKAKEKGSIHGDPIIEIG